MIVDKVKNGFIILSMNERTIKRYFRQKMLARRGNGRRSYVTELENLQVLWAWEVGDIPAEQTAEFIGCEMYELQRLRQEAIEAGKELVS